MARNNTNRSRRSDTSRDRNRTQKTSSNRYNRFDEEEYDNYYDDYEYTPSRKRNTTTATRSTRLKKKKKKKALWVTAVTAVIVIALIAGGLTGAYLWFDHTIGLSNFQSNFGGGGQGMPNEELTNLPDSSQEEIDAANDELEVSKDGLKEIRDTSDVINILLIGTDTRDDDLDTSDLDQNKVMRSDSMMLVSLNSKTKKVVMCSLLRDLYVKIPGYGNDKLNASFFYGGTDLLKQTLKENLYIDVHYFMAVDFFSFIDIVDTIGGIDMKLTKDEIRVMNDSYLIELNKINNEPYGTDYIDYSMAGQVVHLNGKQALAYSRNRYSYNYNDGTAYDFGRTSRQRAVLNAILEKVKTKSILELSALFSKIMPYVTTNMPEDTLKDLIISNILNISQFEIIQTALPQEGTYKDLTIKGAAVLSADFKKNNNYLSDLIYE